MQSRSASIHGFVRALRRWTDRLAELARLDAQEQDRSLWDRGRIREGLRILERAAPAPPRRLPQVAMAREAWAFFSAVSMPSHTASIAVNAGNAEWVVGMSTLTVRNLDDALKARLRVRAAENGRSMEAEARAILRSTLSDSDGPSDRLGSRIQERFAGLAGDKLELPSRSELPRAADLRA